MKDQGRPEVLAKAVELVKAYGLTQPEAEYGLVAAIWDCCLPATAPLAQQLQEKGIAIFEENSAARKWVMTVTDARLRTLAKQAQKSV